MMGGWEEVFDVEDLEEQEELLDDLCARCG
jgi:hypothetical protein